MKNNLFKFLLVLAALTGLAIDHPCYGQVQEMQQLLLDIEKLTQLKSILADMKTGYQIYEQGYGTISGLSKGNFNLHQVYLDGLLAVNPAVGKYGRVAEILSQEASLVSEYKRSLAGFRTSGSFNAGELSYISDVYSRLASESIDNLEELTNVLAAGKLRMSDADRLKAIDRIYLNSTDRLQFLRQFNRQGISLSLQRSHDRQDTQSLQKLYGLIH